MALGRFLEFGFVPIDNGAVERLHVRAALTRKKFLFAGSDAGGERAAIAYTIFAGKRTAGTLPDGVDARYLLGIVKNVHHLHEAEPITEALIRERLAARDRFLAPLVRERDAILAAHGTDVSATLIALVDRLVRAEQPLAFRAEGRRQRTVRRA